MWLRNDDTALEFGVTSDTAMECARSPLSPSIVIFHFVSALWLLCNLIVGSATVVVIGPAVVVVGAFSQIGA